MPSLLHIRKSAAAVNPRERQTHSLRVAQSQKLELQTHNGVRLANEMVCSQNSLGRAEVPTLRRPPMLATCIVRSENVQTTRGSSRSRPRPALCLPVLVSSHRLQDPPNSAYMLGSTSAAGDGLRRLPCFCLLPVSRSFAGRRPCPQTCALPETRSQRRSTRGTNYSRGMVVSAVSLCRLKFAKAPPGCNRGVSAD